MTLHNGQCCTMGYAASPDMPIARIPWVMLDLSQVML